MPKTPCPRRNPSTPSPQDSTSPATSTPRMADSPGGGEYSPSRCNRSARLRADARTRTRSWPGPGSGRGISAIFKTSGPPWPSQTTALIIRPLVTWSIIGIVLQPMLPRREKKRSPESQEDGAVRLDSPGVAGHHALVRPRLREPLLHVLALGVERVADEHRGRQADVVPAEVGQALRAGALHAHARDDRERDEGGDQRFFPLRLLAVGRVDVERMKVQGQQRLPEVVGLGDRAARPVLDDGADHHVLEEQAARLAPAALSHLLVGWNPIHAPPFAQARTSRSRRFAASIRSLRASSRRAASNIGGPII